MKIKSSTSSKSNKKNECQKTSETSMLSNQNPASLNNNNQDSYVEECSITSRKCHLCSSSFDGVNSAFYEHMKAHCHELLNLESNSSSGCERVEMIDSNEKVLKLFQVLESSISKSTTREEEEEEYSKKLLIDCCAELIKKKQELIINNSIEYFLTDECNSSAAVVETPFLLNENEKQKLVQSVSVPVEKQVPRTAQKDFRCKTCGKVFKKSFDLYRHARVHNNERPYKCKLCSKTFKLKCVLETHLRTHMKNSARNPCCSICRKKFSCESSLNVHMRIHTGYKPFKCEECSKVKETTFRTSSQYRSHMLCKHSIKTSNVAISNLCETYDSIDECFLDNIASLNDIDFEEQEANNNVEMVKTNDTIKRKSKDSKYFDENYKNQPTTSEEYTKNKCELCDHLFLSEEDNLNHFLKKHGANVLRRYECSCCKKLFLKPSQLERHSLVSFVPNHSYKII